MFALQFDNVRQVTEGTSDSLLIAQFSPQRQTFFGQRTRNLEVTRVPGGDPERV
jgi:hypothetical protein